MMNMPNSHTGTSTLGDQFKAAAVGAVNSARKAAEQDELARQNAAFDKALEAMSKVREFLVERNKILGNERTKHGEIAEQVEVGTRRAKDFLNQQEPTATFDGVGRTAPHDYRIDELLVQSKFINGVNNTLDHVLEHMEKYKNFGRDGSFYHIPKDQHELIEKLLRGEPIPDLSEKSVKAILAKVAEIERQTAKPFQQVVQPGVSSYAEVQQGKVGETLDKHEQDLRDQNEELKERIKEDHKPSLADGAKAVAGAAAVGAAVSLATGLIHKYLDEGKSPFKGDYTTEDWKELGIDTAKGAAIGGITGGVIYALTNYANMSAPFAGSFVSAVKGIAPLVEQYQAGKLSLDALLDQGTFVCADVALVGLCTIAGQTLIPVPILGAVIGSIAGKVLSSLLDSKVAGAAEAIARRSRETMEALDNSCRAVLRQIEEDFERLGQLTVAAFDLSLNEQLVQRSVELAKAYGVEECKLLKTNADLHAFMLS